MLLDLGLGGMSGFEVARRLRTEVGLDQAVFAAMTGFGQLDDRRQTQEARFHAHFVKPLDLTALQDLLDHV